MKINVVGDNSAAITLRSYLASKFNVGDGADYTVTLEAVVGLKSVVLDSVDSALERHIMRHVCEQSSIPVTVKRKGGVQSDVAIIIQFPMDNDVMQQVALGVHRGMLDLFNVGDGRVELRPQAQVGAAPITPADMMMVTQKTMTDGLNQIAVLLVQAGERAAVRQATAEVSAFLDTSSLRMEAQVAALQSTVEQNLASVEQRVEVAVDDMRQEFIVSRNLMLNELRAEFAPRPLAHPGFWRSLWALLRGRFVVYDRPLPPTANISK